MLTAVVGASSDTPPANLVSARGGEGQSQKGLLLQLVRLGGARGGAGAAGALHRTHAQAAGFGQALQPREDVKMRAHIGGFFLDPDDFAGMGMLGDGGGDFRARQGIKLIEEEDRRSRIFTAAAFAAQLVANLAAGDQDAPGVLHFAIGDEWQKPGPREFFDLRAGVGMAQHAFWRKDNQRLAPGAAHLTAQHVEILGGSGRLADLHVVFGSQLHETLKTGAGMFRALAFVAVREEHDETGRQIPLVLARADELVDDDLRTVGEITELRLPQDKSFGIVAAETIFESEATCLGERRVVNLAEGLLLGEMRESEVVVLGLRINEHRVALAEGAALRILSREAHGVSFKKHGAESQRFGKAVINGALAVTHLRALFEELHDFRVNVKTFRHAHEAIGDFRELLWSKAGIDFVGHVIAAMLVGRPVVRQLAQVRYFS